MQPNSNHRKPKIIIIVAMTPSGVIGVRGKNELPWRAVGEKLIEDLPRFEKITTGNGNNALVFGRNTLESFRNKALPNRKNFVLSRKENYSPPDGVTRFFDLDSALSAAQDCDQIFIIGGEKVIEEALKRGLAHKMILTITRKEYEGDVMFPKYDVAKWAQRNRSAFPQWGYDVITLEHIQ